MLNGRPGTVTLERFFFACVLTQKVKKVYHLVGRPLKVPCLGPGARTAGSDVVLRDVCYGVARSGAGRDPVALLAKEPIGITRYGKCKIKP
jgi:hypothetical protein